jgi:exonuclease III
MKILSINIKGGGEPSKVEEVLAFLKSNKINIAFLCESHMTEERIDKYRNRWKQYGWISNSPNPNSCRSTFIIMRPDKIPLDSCEIVKTDQQGRQLGIRFLAEGSPDPIYILGIYAPNGETTSVNFFNQLNNNGEEQHFDIMLGDFNRCLEPHDRNPTRSEDNWVQESLRKGTRHGELIDGWRETYPDRRYYTYWSNNYLRSASRLDRIYVTQPIFRKCLQWNIVPTPPWTDHHAVSVEYCPGDKIETGPGQWYMNVHLLQHRAMRATLTDALIEKLGPLAELLEAPNAEGHRPPLANKPNQVVQQFDQLLDCIRDRAQTIQLKLARQRMKVMKRMDKKIERLNILERTIRESKKLKILATRREALMQVIAKRKKMLSKAKWLEMGTRRRADFWKLGNTPVENRTIQGLQDANGKIQKKSSEITKIARGYYSSLYSKREMSEKHQDELLKKVPRGDFTNTTGPVTREEVLRVI